VLIGATCPAAPRRQGDLPVLLEERIVSVTTNPVETDTETQRYLVVSCDSHVGPRLVEDLRPYCDQKHLADFDDFVDNLERSRSISLLDGGTGLGGIEKHYPTERWEATRALPGLRDPHARIRDMDEEGVAADVVFHGAQSIEVKPFDKCGDQHLEAVGKRIYNRWLADFVSVEPERHVGVAELPIWDVELSVKEMEFAREAGLGAVSFPAPRRDFPAYNTPVWEDFWAASVALEMPLDCHAGLGDSPHYDGVESFILFMSEVAWYGRRALQYMIFGQVFERHPQLKVIFTEQRADWVGDTLRHLDSLYNSYYCKNTGVRDLLSKSPSEYWKQNCYVGASFLARFEAEQRYEIGVDRLMWGSDYPHVEGTYGVTREHLRNTFSGIATDEVQAILADNAIECYNLDAERLRPIGARIGPTHAELATPIDGVPEGYVGGAFRQTGPFS
jgi:predicted TIM-barrel fold metal-dependent hydrolase